MTDTEKTLTKVLQDAGVYNEDGEQMVDFTNRNRDSQDFASCSRGQLHDMLLAAFEAGRKQGTAQ